MGVVPLAYVLERRHAWCLSPFCFHSNFFVWIMVHSTLSPGVKSPMKKSVHTFLVEIKVYFYLRRFSESRSSSGSTPSVRLSVRSSVRPFATLFGCLVCVICNSNSFHSFIFKLCLMIVQTTKMCTSYFVHI